MVICDVAACSNRAEVWVRFTTTPSRPVPYCAWHARRRGRVLVWRLWDIADVESI